MLGYSRVYVHQQRCKVINASFPGFDVAEIRKNGSKFLFVGIFSVDYARDPHRYFVAATTSIQYSTFVENYRE